MGDTTLKYDVQVDLSKAKAFAVLEKQLQDQTAKVKQLNQAYDDLANKLKKLHDAGGSSGGGGFHSAINDGLKNLLAKIPLVGGMMSHLSEPIGQVAAAFQKAAGVGGFACGAIAGGLSAVAVAAGTATKALAEFAGYQTRLARLDSVLANNGLLTDAYRQKLIKLAEQFQDTTGVASEQWLSVLKRLTQFGVKPDKIDEYADAVKNLAGIMGTSVERAGMIMTRIISGSTMGGLSRFGLVLQHTGDKAKDLEANLRIINAMGAGQLESQLTTINGLMGNLKNQTGEVMKNLGAKISETGVVQQVLRGWAMGFHKLRELTDTKVPITEGITNKGETLQPALGHDKEEMYQYKLAQEETAEATKRATEAVHEQRTALEQHYKALKDIADAPAEV